MVPTARPAVKPPRPVRRPASPYRERERESPGFLGSADCAKVLKAMGDPTRLRILRHLVGGEKNVSELVKELGADQSSVSHHLALLRRAGLVLEHRRGKNVYNQIHPSVAENISGREDKINLGCCAVQIRKE